MIPRIAVAGSLNMDLVVRAPRIPQPGETLIGADLQSVPGGKGANQALAAARLGAQVAMIGCVGSDAHAEALLANLRAAGVDTAFVRVDTAAPSGVALIVVDDAGQNSIVVSPGANRRLSPADIDTAEPAIVAAGVLMLQLETPVETVVHAAQVARAHGVRVVLNPAPARPLSQALLSHVDVLIPNESEAHLLTGLPVESHGEIKAAAVALHALGIETVVITLGARGALWSAAGERELVPAFHVQVVDTTAAGDAFVAGFAVAQAKGLSTAQAVRWGNAAGALAATRFGAGSSLPLRREVEELLRRDATA